MIVKMKMIYVRWLNQELKQIQEQEYHQVVVCSSYNWLMDSLKLHLHLHCQFAQCIGRNQNQDQKMDLAMMMVVAQLVLLVQLVEMLDSLIQ